MRFGSVCSGIEAASVAWHPLGWEPAFYAEIEAFPSAVLAHRFPHVPNLGDFTQIGNDHGPVDLLVGGTPCQSFSVAGLRGGLDDPRGGLALHFLRLAERLGVRWLVWENVPGVLSSNGGRDFGAFLGALVELGYGFAYRVLDAQYFGVPQRRRRVFVVAHLGDWRPAAAVLFEPESLSGNPPQKRPPGHQPAEAALRGAGEYGHVAHAVTCHAAKGGDPTTDNYLAVARTLLAKSNASHQADRETYAPVAFHATQDPISGQVTPALSSHAQVGVLAFGENQRGELTLKTMHPALGRGGGKPGQGYPAVCITGTVTHTLKAEGFDASEDGTGRGQPIVPTATAVRRLTPRECEALQGFPRDFTLIPWRKGMAPDGPRYKALGNSMAVPVMRWIGERIDMVDRTLQRRSA